MKVKFTKLPTTDGTIKVSLDGGQSFMDYNVADIHEDGISLEDNQNYDKIQIRGPANLLKNLDIVSSVKVEGGQAEEPVLEISADNGDRTTHVVVFFNEAWLKSVLPVEYVNTCYLMLNPLSSETSPARIEGVFMPEELPYQDVSDEDLQSFSIYGDYKSPVLPSKLYWGHRTFSNCNYVQIIFAGAKREILYNEVFPTKNTLIG